MSRNQDRYSVKKEASPLAKKSQEVRSEKKLWRQKLPRVRSLNDRTDMKGGSFEDLSNS